jgi:hypothetical protein
MIKIYFVVHHRLFIYFFFALFFYSIESFSIIVRMFNMIHLYVYLDHINERSMITSNDTPDDEIKIDYQRSLNGIRVSSSVYDVHRGDDFYKKLMFYEKNGSTNHETASQNNSNPLSTSIHHSSRRSSFHQSSSIPSNTQTFTSPINRQTQPIVSRPNLVTPVNKPSTTTILAERMQRSKSYKDLLDSPSATVSITHPVYQQQHPSSSNHPSTAYYSSSYQSHMPISNIAGSMLGNSSNNVNVPVDYSRCQVSSMLSNGAFVLDDISSSSAGHLPKPPPGMPSQNVRYNFNELTSRRILLINKRYIFVSFFFRRRRFKVDNIHGRSKDYKRDGSFERSPMT